MLKTPPLSVNSQHFQMLKRMLEGAGLNLPDVIQNLGYSKELSLEAYTAADYLKIMAHSAYLLEDESLALTTRKILPGTHDFVLQNVNEANSVLSVFKSISNAYNIIHGGKYNFAESADRRVSYIINDRDFPYPEPGNNQYIEFTLENLLVYVHAVIDLLLGGKATAKLTKIETRVRENSLLKSVFTHCPVEHKEHIYALHYDCSILNEPLFTSADLTLTFTHVLDGLSKRLGSYNMKPEIITKIHKLFNQKLYNQDEVASKLNQSVATLKRKLKNHDTSFKDLKDIYLNQQAKQLLSQGIDIEDIASTLGFSSARSFNRAFKSWNAITPSSFLKKHG